MYEQGQASFMPLHPLSKQMPQVGQAGVHLAEMMLKHRNGNSCPLRSSRDQKSAQMMNSSVSISEFSPSPAEIPDKSPLGLQKSDIQALNGSPFHQLMAEIAAQQGALPTKIQTETPAPLPADAMIAGDRRQETAGSDTVMNLALMLGADDPGLGKSLVHDPVLMSAMATQIDQTGTGAPSQALPETGLTSLAPTIPLFMTAMTGSAFHAGPPLTTTTGALTGALTTSPNAEWKETRLSQTLTVITQPLSQLNEGNLQDFAMQQGLDADTVRWLLGEQSTHARMAQTAGQLNAAGSLHPTVRESWIDLSAITTGALEGLIKATANHVNLKAGVADFAVGSDFELPLMPESEMGDTGQNGSAQTGLQGHHTPAMMRHHQESAGTKPFGLPLNTTLLGQDLADKMSTAIGQRMLESIEKGEWQLKIHLKPVELGHIEVDLKMRDNALEAKFTASQSVARELLESGLGRLKDTLQQSGMDVASVRVNDGPSSRNGGDSTPRQPQQGHFGSPKENVSRESEAPVAKGNSSISDGRLDLMV